MYRDEIGLNQSFLNFDPMTSMRSDSETIRPDLIGVNVNSTVINGNQRAIRQPAHVALE